jgi:hypothetical protein
MSGSGGIGGGSSTGSTSSPDVSAFGEASVAAPEAQVLIHFPYNLNTDIVSTDTSGSGAVTHSGQFAVVASGAATSSSGTLNSIKTLNYHPGMGGLCRFTTIFGTGTLGNTQIAGVGSDTDGFFFGYNETSFGILLRAGSSDTWIPQTSWNTDPMDGTGPSGMTLDTSKGNVFQIRYQWLGFGAIRFYIENESTGNLEQVHRIDYTNANTTVSVNNPSFPFHAQSINTTNSTDIQLKIPSIGMYVEGKVSGVGSTRNAFENAKTITTETNIFTIRVRTTFESVVNLVDIQPDFLALAADGTKNVVFRVYVNATLGGTPSFSNLRVNNSVVEVDTAGTTVSGGVLVASIPVGKAQSTNITFPGNEVILTPGASLTVSAESSGSNDVIAAFSWRERFT